jgi:hypothetical protein
MIKLILAVVLVMLLLVGGLAIALFHFWGWKGMVAFPFILVVLVWVAKVIIGQIIKRVGLALFSMKSSALRGASITVHSVTPVAKPVEEETEEDEDEEEEDEHAMKHEGEDGEIEDENEDEDDEDDDEEDEDEEDEEEEPRQYYAVELTVTPKEEGQGRVWEPGEFMLASEKIKSLGDLEEKEVGSAEQVQVWNGTEYGPDDECKYPGTQRLKVTFAVKPGTSKAWLQYYNETLGSLDLPPWQVVATT